MKLRTTLPFLTATAGASAIAWLALAEIPAPGGPPAGTTIQHVILITVDGLRGDLLKNLMDGPTGAATYPNFNRLRSDGASTFEARCDFDYSETLPNHVSVVTGRPVLQPAGAPNTVHHGFTANFPSAGQTFHTSGNLNIPYKASIFDVVHDNGLSTALFYSKDRISFVDISYNSTTGAPDVTGTDNGPDKIDFASVGVTGTTAGTTAMSHLLTHLATNPLPGFTLLHFVDPDKSGHASGWDNATWNTSVAASDTALGQLFAWLDAHPVEKATTSIVLTADHGGAGSSHNNATQQVNYTIPFFLWGQCFKPGTSAYSYFINRASPGAARPAQADSTLQPLRNADCANLSTALLGLGTVPGSWFQPAFMDPEAQKQLLKAAPEGSGIRVSWPVAAAAYRLESATDINGAWTPVTAGITTQGASLTYLNQEPGGRRFFRLRRD